MMSDLNYPNKNWMNNLPDDVKELPIIYIAIPGTHNSMTYGITNKSVVALDADKTVHRIYRIFPCFVRRWSITQSVGVTTQLKHGIRYFDLRISIKDNTKFYFAHGLYAMEVYGPLNEINRFLEKNPEEVVILDFQHFYGFTVHHHKQLQYDLLRIFECKFYGRDCGSLQDCSLRSCSMLNKQVLLIYRKYHVVPKEFWPEEYWPTPWPNTCSITKLKEYLNKSLERRKPNTGYVSQCILTPTSKYILLRVGSSLKGTATKVDKKMNDWIIQQRIGQFEPNENPTANVFLADFIHILDADFCKKVIDLNRLSSISYTDCTCDE